MNDLEGLSAQITPVALVDQDGNFITSPGATGDIAMPVTQVGSYNGQQVVSGNSASQTVTPPAGTQTIWVTARAGPVYVSINQNASAASSGYYIPEDKVMIIGPFNNITTLGIWTATGDFAHLIFEK